MKKVKVLGVFNKTVKMECPNCQESIYVNYKSNEWHESFSGDCDTCGYKFEIKDTEFDYIQPDSPFFELIFKYCPEKHYEMNKKKHEWDRQQRKKKLEEKYYNQYRSESCRGSFRKTWEKRAIEKEVLKDD